MKALVEIKNLAIKEENDEYLSYNQALEVWCERYNASATAYLQHACRTASVKSIEDLLAEIETMLLGRPMSSAMRAALLQVHAAYGSRTEDGVEAIVQIKPE